LAGISDPVSTNFYKIGWASDSVSTSMGAYNMLYNAKMLKPATYGTYPYISDYNGQVPAGVKIRVPTTTSTDQHLFVSVFPSNLELAESPRFNVTTGIPQDFYQNYSGTINLTGNLKVYGADDRFVSSLAYETPPVPAKAGRNVTFKAKTPVQLTDYGHPAPPGAQWTKFYRIKYML